MITFILIAIFGLLAIALVLLAWGASSSNGKSGAENRGTSQDPKVGRASGLD